MDAFFKNPAPPGREARRLADHPRLARVWRIGDDGRAHHRWTAETADLLPFRTASPAAPASPRRERAA
jgi:hypothetical protein